MAKAHSTRTIIVMTRIAADTLHVTYCNALTEAEPYITTVVLGGPPFTPIGVAAEDIPEVGHTKSVCTH